jgi:hemolysin III
MHDSTDTSPSPAPAYTFAAELSNAITHGVGALLSIAGLVILIVAAAGRGDAWHIVSFSLFGVSALMLYTMSTLYHAIPDSRAKRVFKVLDHISIYLLIAGSYTPFALVALRSSVGWLVFGVVWGAAALGIAVEPFVVGKAKALSALIYIAMGWIVAFAWKPLTQAIGPHTLVLLMAGGIAYTAGALFYVMKRWRWSHPVWHLFVAAGTIVHFFAVMSLLP